MHPDVMLRPCLDLVQMDGKCNSVGPLSSVNMSKLSQSSGVDIQQCDRTVNSNLASRDCPHGFCVVGHIRILNRVFNGAL